MENRSSDTNLWRSVISSDKVSELIEEGQLIQLMEKSDAISLEVAYYIEKYECCDIQKLTKWIIDNSSDYTVKHLAENGSTPKKTLKKLLTHENTIISIAAKSNLDEW